MATERDVTFRLARDEDLLRTREVFLETAEALNRQHGVSSSPAAGAPHERSMAYRRHALRLDAERFWVAEVAGTVIGFGVATQRANVWYLASLYVLPEFQDRGIGSGLLDRCLVAARPGSILTVLSEAMQPVSNALYMRRGMFPEEPLLGLTGPADFVPSATDLHLEPFMADGPDREVLDSLDADVLGFRRPEEHHFWAEVPDLHGFLVKRGHHDVGYVYTAETGAIGPCAVRAQEDLAPAIELGIARARAMGATEARLRIPGIARDALRVLIRRGFRLEESMTLFLSSEQLGSWDRYLTSGADAFF